MVISRSYVSLPEGTSAQGFAGRGMARVVPPEALTDAEDDFSLFRQPLQGARCNGQEHQVTEKTQ